MTLLFDSGVILKREIRCNHFQGFEHKHNKNDAEYILCCSEHERNCQYAPTQCPNSLHCPTLLKMVSDKNLKIK